MTVWSCGGGWEAPPFVAMQLCGNVAMQLRGYMAISYIGVQKSDAGVGIGTLIGDRDCLARKLKKSFMFFARN